MKDRRHMPRIISPEHVSSCVVALHQCEPDAELPAVPCSAFLSLDRLQKPLYSQRPQN